MDTISETKLFVTLLAIAVSAPGFHSQPLPGIFSPYACSGANQTGQLAAVCHCMYRYDVMNVTQFCSNISKLANCIEEQVSYDATNSSYLRLVFDREQFMKKAQLTCSHRQVLGLIRDCNSTIPKCDSLFLKKISETNAWDEKQACSVANSLGLCYWEQLRHCPGRVRHMWSILAEVYVTNTCTQYDLSIHHLCENILHAHYPMLNNERKNFTQCIETVSTQRECFETLRLDSIHHTHLWENMEFELDRFTQFEKLRCTLETDRKFGCDGNLHKCSEPFGKNYAMQTSMIQNGTMPTMKQICDVYDEMITCVGNATSECPKAQTYHYALWCGMMPKSCHCPIDVQGKHKPIHGSGPSHHTSGPLYLCLTVVVVQSLLQY